MIKTELIIKFFDSRVPKKEEKTYFANGFIIT